MLLGIINNESITLSSKLKENDVFEISEFDTVRFRTNVNAWKGWGAVVIEYTLTS